MISQSLCGLLLLAVATADYGDYGTPTYGTDTADYDGGEVAYSGDYAGAPKGYDPNSPDSKSPKDIEIPHYSCQEAAAIWDNTTVAGYASGAKKKGGTSTGCWNFPEDTASPTPAPRTYNAATYDPAYGTAYSSAKPGYTYDATAARKGSYDSATDTYNPYAAGEYKPAVGGGAATYDATSVPTPAYGSGAAAYTSTTGTYEASEYDPATGKKYDQSTYDAGAGTGYDPSSYDATAVRGGSYDADGSYNPNAKGTYTPGANGAYGTYTPEKSYGTIPEAYSSEGYGGRRLGQTMQNLRRRLKRNLYLIAEDKCVWAYENLVHNKDNCEITHPVQYFQAVARIQHTSLYAQQTAWNGLVVGLGVGLIVVIVVVALIFTGIIGKVLGTRRN